MASFTFNTTRQPRSGKRERLTVGVAAVPLTVTSYKVNATAGANQEFGMRAITPTAAVIQVNANPISWTIDGSVPSAAVGFAGIAGDFIYLDSYQKIQAFQSIRTGAADATLEVVYLYGV